MVKTIGVKNSEDGVLYKKNVFINYYFYLNNYYIYE